MATLTPSGLIKPDYTDPASVLDINDNSRAIDAAGLGALVIEGDTFPTDPWEGMKVYKVDHQELYVFSTFGGNVDPGQWWLVGAGRKHSYTPVVQNVVLGTGGSSEGQYIRVGHNGLPNAIAIHFRVRITLGTGGDVTSSIAFGLPGVPEMWPGAGVDFMKPVGHAVCVLSGAGASGAASPGILICNNVTVVGNQGETQQIVNVTPDTVNLGSLWNAALPFNWASGSTLWAQGQYWPDQNGTSWS